MIQVLLNGVISGLGIALLALAFVVALPTRVFYLALAGIYAGVPYLAWALIDRGWPWYVAVVPAALAGVAVSVGAEVFTHEPLERRGASAGAHLVSSLGLYIVLVQGIVLVWGNDPKLLRTGLDPVCTLGNVVLTRMQLIEAAVPALFLAGFFAWLASTGLGLQLRALAEAPEWLAALGYNVRVLRALAFAVAGLLAAAVALPRAFDLGIEPHGGLHTLLLAIVAAVVGGRQSFLGPVLGGVAVGVLRAEAVWLLSSRWQEAVTFLVLGAFLLLRPRGLLGKPGRLESDS